MCEGEKERRRGREEETGNGPQIQKMDGIIYTASIDFNQLRKSVRNDVVYKPFLTHTCMDFNGHTMKWKPKLMKNLANALAHPSSQIRTLKGIGSVSNEIWTAFAAEGGFTKITGVAMTAYPDAFAELLQIIFGQGKLLLLEIACNSLYHRIVFGRTVRLALKYGKLTHFYFRCHGIVGMYDNDVRCLRRLIEDTPLEVLSAFNQHCSFAEQPHLMEAILNSTRLTFVGIDLGDALDHARLRRHVSLQAAVISGVNLRDDLAIARSPWVHTLCMLIWAHNKGYFKGLCLDVIRRLGAFLSIRSQIE